MTFGLLVKKSGLFRSQTGAPPEMRVDSMTLRQGNDDERLTQSASSPSSVLFQAGCPPTDVYPAHPHPACNFRYWREPPDGKVACRKSQVVPRPFPFAPEKRPYHAIPSN